MVAKEDMAAETLDTKVSVETISFGDMESYDSESMVGFWRNDKSFYFDKDRSLAINLAHQLSNKITPIISHLEVLRKSKLNKSDKRRVDIIFESAIGASNILSKFSCSAARFVL